MERVNPLGSPFSGTIDDKELTFAKLDLKTKSPSTPHLKIQTPRGLVITIPSGMDKETVEIVMSSLWRMPC